MGVRRTPIAILLVALVTVALLVTQLERGGVQRNVAEPAAPAAQAARASAPARPRPPTPQDAAAAATGRASLAPEVPSSSPTAEPAAPPDPEHASGLKCFRDGLRKFRVHGRLRMYPFEIVSASACVITLSVNRKFAYMGPQGSAHWLVALDMCKAARLVGLLRAQRTLFWDGSKPSYEACDWRSVFRATGNYSRLHDMYHSEALKMERDDTDPPFDGAGHRARFRRYPSCALVGGSPTLLAAEFGGAIDAHAAVFRFNDHPAGGAHAAQVGRRTTHRVTNCIYATDSVSESGKVAWLRPSALNGTQVVQVCTRPVRFKQSVQTMARDGPVHRHMIAPEVLGSFYDHFQTGGLTGAIGVWLLLGMCERVSLFGFTSPCDLGVRYAHYHDESHDELVQVNTIKVILWTHALRCAGLVHWAVADETADTCGAARTLTAGSSAPPGRDDGREIPPPMWRIPASRLDSATQSFAAQQTQTQTRTRTRTRTPRSQPRDGDGDSEQPDAAERAQPASDAAADAAAPPPIIAPVPPAVAAALRAALDAEIGPELGGGVIRKARAALALAPSAWRLYTYAPPYEALGVSAGVLREYQRLLAADEPPPDGADEGGLYRALAVELPLAMRPWTPPPGLGGVDAWGGRNLLFLLPLSPYHFCRAAEPALGASWGPAWARAKGVIPVHVLRAMAAATLDGLRSHSLACPAYDRVLRWLFEQPAWQLAPERHVFAHAMVHLPRVARETTDRAPRADGSGAWAEVGRAIVVGAEDRRHDWRAAAAAGRTVFAPLHSPDAFFLAPAARAPAELRGAPAAERAAAAAELTAALASKDTLISASHFGGVKCHRYDEPSRPTAWACAEYSAAHAREVRAALSAALGRLEEAGGVAVRELPTTRLDTLTPARLGAILARKSELMKRSTFCLIPPGDTVVTARVFSAVAALCVPVLFFPVAFLPFGALVDWADMTLSLESSELVAYAREPADTAALNPLRRLAALALEQPERLAAMQRALADARWLLHYRTREQVRADAGGAAVVGAAAVGAASQSQSHPTAASALVHHLVLAAKQRTRAALAARTPDGGARAAEAAERVSR